MSAARDEVEYLQERAIELLDEAELVELNDQEKSNNQALQPIAHSLLAISKVLVWMYD